MPVWFGHITTQSCGISKLEKNRSGDVSGVDIACVGSDAAWRANGFVRRSRRKVSLHFLAERFWLAGIETSGDSGMTN